MSQVYTKTSVYKFPDTAENNKINMMADRNFAKLEKMVFTNLDKIDDRGLADVVYALSNNHREEQGTLRPKQFDKVLEAVLKEFQDRLPYIEESLVGSMCKSLSHLPVFQRLGDSEDILDKVLTRVRGVKDTYAL